MLFDASKFCELINLIKITSLNFPPLLIHLYVTVWEIWMNFIMDKDRHGRDHMVLGFTTTCAIIADHHYSCEFESHSWQGVLDTTLCDKVCQWLAAGRWFSPGTPVSSTNKTDCHDITVTLLKVAVNTINSLWVTCKWPFLAIRLLIANKAAV